MIFVAASGGACSSSPAPQAEGGGGSGATSSSHHATYNHATTVGEGGTGATGSSGNEPKTPTAIAPPVYGDIYRGTQFDLQSQGSSTPSGNALTFAWSQVSGAHVDLVDPTSPNQLVTAPDALGPLVFQLVVYDGPLASLPVEVAVTVLDRLPVAHAGHDKGGLGGSVVTLDGSAKDDDGDALTYSWTQVSGTPIALTDATLAQASLTLPAGLSGPAVFALTVNDGFADSTPDWVTVERLSGPDTDGDLLEDTMELTLGTDPANPDTDRDGIPDGWEVLGHEGVDYAALGCDALHRDLLVELHVQTYMVGNVVHSGEPSPIIRAALESFYAQLPIANPDGLPGIALHLVDDVPVGQAFVCPNIASGAIVGDTQPLNFLYREAFHKAFVCLAGGQSSAEIGGRQLYLQISELDADPSNDAVETNAFAYYSIFIHEMGHNLGLHHGGFEDLNFKPNYPSAMNYELISGLGGPHTIQGSNVAYSAGALPSVDECALVETAAFAGVPPGDLAYLSSYTPVGWTVAADGSVDWNHNGMLDASPYILNLRDATSPMDCHLLKDHDDFAEIASGMADSLPSNPNGIMPFAFGASHRHFELVP